MRSLFITGVGGFIGLCLARRALAQGVHVSGVDSAASAVARARTLGVAAQLGDITDAVQISALLREHAPGVDTVIHTAAIVREHGALEEFRRVNVQGSLNVARAARAAGASTFVQLSSVMVYGFDFPPNVAEDGPLDGAGNPYCQTKIESEAAVHALHDAGAFGVIIIRPGDVYGPGSVPWIARPLQMLRKRQMFLPLGGNGVINHVHVENLVDGIFLAIEQRAHGETFNLTDGRATTFREFYARLARQSGLPGPMSLPAPLLKVLARGLQALHARGLTKDEASADTVRYLMRRNTYSIDKARRMLGYAPKLSLDAGLAGTQAFIDAELSHA